MPTARIHVGDALATLCTLTTNSVHTCITSPPYWGLRDYGETGQLGLERTPDEYVARLVSVFREARRVLRDDGTLWLNLGDSYAGSGKGPSNNSELARPYRGMSNISEAPNRWISIPANLKPKDLVGIPWRVAFALQAEGWFLRSDIIWAKPNPMPESVTDRPTKAHEYLFLMAKSQRYYYDAEAVAEEANEQNHHDYTGGGTPGRLKQDSAGNRRYTGFNARYFSQDAPATRNKRSVWRVVTQPYPEAHFATYPPKLIEPCVLAGCPEGGVVLDPFSGAGTTGLVALRNNRDYLGIELNAEYAEMSCRRIYNDGPLLNDVELVAAKETACR